MPARAPQMLLTRRQAAAAIAAPLLAAAIPAAGSSAARPQRPGVPSRGFNLPGWVDRTDGTAPSRPVLEKLHALGFRSVRLPVDGNLLLGGGAGARAALAAIGKAAATLVDAGYAVIVDLHPSGNLSDALRHRPVEGARLATAAWTALAPVVADLPAGKVFAELLNEPPMEHADWLALRGRLAETIRKRCPGHTLVWGPARYQGIWEIVATTPLADPNAIAAVHYYSPMAFTHQCENWMKSPLERLSRLPFPATGTAPAVEAARARLERQGDEKALAFLDRELRHPWTGDAIAGDFARLARWSRTHDCPVVLDEFGALGFCAAPGSRANWVGAVRRAAEENGAGWIYWELDQGFGFIRSRSKRDGFDMEMIDAMMGR